MTANTEWTLAPGPDEPPSGVRSWAGRVLVPVLGPLILLTAASLVHELSREWAMGRYHAALAWVTGPLMFIGLWLGALIVTPWAYFRGASFGERMAAALVVPAAWGAKTWSSGLGIYSAGEMAFLAFHHMVLGAPVVGLSCLGLADTVCRRLHRRSAGNEDIKVWGLGNTLVFLAGTALATLMLWNGGHFYYFQYMNVYTWLFSG